MGGFLSIRHEGYRGGSDLERVEMLGGNMCL